MENLLFSSSRRDVFYALKQATFRAAIRPVWTAHQRVCMLCSVRLCCDISGTIRINEVSGRRQQLLIIVLRDWGTTQTWILYVCETEIVSPQNMYVSTVIGI